MRNAPIKVDVPYPPIDGITQDLEAAAIIAPAYGGPLSEINAICQYVYQHFRFSVEGKDDIAETILGIALTEMHHFAILGEMLLHLGVNPVISATPPRPANFYSTCNVKYSTLPRKMIMDDITGELEAIREYESMLAKLCNEEVAAVIERIILDEKLHVDVLNVIFAELDGGGV